MKIKITEKSKKDFSTLCILHTKFNQIDSKLYQTIKMGYVYCPYIPLYSTYKKTKWVPF